MDLESQLIVAYYKQLGAIAQCLEKSVVAIGNYGNVGRVVVSETISDLLF